MISHRTMVAVTALAMTAIDEPPGAIPAAASMVKASMYEPLAAALRVSGISPAMDRRPVLLFSSTYVQGIVANSAQPRPP
jgi:hypothetical protein